MINLKFILDKDYDSQMLFEMLESDDPAGLESRAGLMGIELSTAKKVKDMDLESAGKILEPIINQRYEAIGSKLEITKEWYQKSWDEINDKFFNFIAKRTEHNWQHKKYLCVVSVIHPGLSNWGGNKIVRIWSENPYTMRKITAHELIISHIFSIFQNNPKYKDKLDDNQVWKITEISAWCLTGLEQELIKFWPWIPKNKLFYYAHNYPTLVDLQKELKKIYEKTNFNEFLDRAIEMVKK